MKAQTSENRAGFGGLTVPAALAVVTIALLVRTPLELGKGKETIQVKALAYRVETARIPPIAPGQVVYGPLGPSVAQTEAVNRERQRTDIYQEVEANGIVYTLTCGNCNALEAGGNFEAEIRGTLMWIKRPKDTSGSKTIKVRYAIVDARPKE